MQGSNSGYWLESFLGGNIPKSDKYSYYPMEKTNDGEWEWDELLGWLVDECLKVCNTAKAEQGRAWRYPELLHENNLRDAVLGKYDIMEQYNTMGWDLFERWLPSIVKVVMDSNRPDYIPHIITTPRRNYDQ